MQLFSENLGFEIRLIVVIENLVMDWEILASALGGEIDLDTQILLNIIFIWNVLLADQLLVNMYCGCIKYSLTATRIMSIIHKIPVRWTGIVLSYIHHILS